MLMKNLAAFEFGFTISQDSHEIQEIGKNLCVLHHPGEISVVPELQFLFPPFLAHLSGSWSKFLSHIRETFGNSILIRGQIEKRMKGKIKKSTFT